MSTIRDERHRRLDELSVRASRAYVESGLHGNVAEVVLALEVSAAMAPLYANGFVGELATALLALGMKFDDNERVPLWTFDRGATHHGELRQGQHRGFVERHVKPSLAAASGSVTRLGPLIDAIGRRYFPEEWERPPTNQKVGDKLKKSVAMYPTVDAPRPCPVFVVVVASGDCDDVREATQLLRRSSFLPIYWQFIGVDVRGDPKAFRVLKSIDKLADTWVDNCGFFVPAVDPLPEPAGSGLVRKVRFDLDEHNLYAGLLNELPRWFDEPRAKAMLVEPVRADNDTADEIDGLIAALPEKERARRERERLEREQRRKQRAAEADLELQQAEAWPTIRAQAELEEEEDAEPAAVRARYEGRRLVPSTRPYQPADGPVPGATKRRPTQAFAAAEAPRPVAPRDDEGTVETAAERLARIRARRNARRTDPGEAP